jgi:hypothetical protein
MQLPQINLNGSDGMDLASQYQDAANAIEHAINLMGRIPHGRDYQTLPDGAFTTARREMLERINPMITAREEMLALANHCAESAR